MVRRKIIFHREAYIFFSKISFLRTFCNQISTQKMNFEEQKKRKISKSILQKIGENQTKNQEKTKKFFWSSKKLNKKNGFFFK
jgi:hypothetical protein